VAAVLAVCCLHIIIGSVLYPWVNCTGIRTLNPGFRGSPLAHGYKTDPIMIHKRVTGVLCVRWAMSAAVFGRGVPCGDKQIIIKEKGTSSTPLDRLSGP